LSGCFNSLAKTQPTPPDFTRGHLVETCKLFIQPTVKSILLSGRREMSEEKSVFKPTPRIQTLSDLIFGLALSIGALTLIGQQPTDFQAIVASLLFYSFSFLVLVSVWRSYSSILSVLPVETESLISLNILLLFTVSVEPYLFNQLFHINGAAWNYISILYAADIAVMFMVLAFFNHSLGNEEKSLAPKNYLKKFRLDRNYDIVTAVIFLVSMLPFFEITVAHIGDSGIPLRVLVWIGALIFGLTRRLLFRFNS
jgi:uncharacterized membrane protein